MNQILTREDFKTKVFERDNHCCVACGEPAVDAHHITERKLWSDGGYYLDNGASVCPACHWKAETTELSVNELLTACGIKQAILPVNLEPHCSYDKWGNRILNSNTRLAGPLFNDEQVQKVLASRINSGKLLFVMNQHLKKYPRTFHVPWSLGCTSDDKKVESMEPFYGKEVVITEKLDGENTTMYRDYIHARSLDSRHHVSRDWVKTFHASICNDIPEGWRICGENLYAQHSIEYSNLDSYFYGFSIWDENNVCLSWPDTREWFSLLGIEPVQQLASIIYDEDFEETYKNGYKIEPNVEGYVMRLKDSFHYDDFKTSVAKFVRADHVQTDTHWMSQEVKANQLKKC